ncbi:MAG: hypothetical protein WD002_04955 [Pseudomonadales bacterium]
MNLVQKSCLAIVAILLLAACSGGGGRSTTPPPVTTTQVAEPTTVTSTASFLLDANTRSLIHAPEPSSVTQAVLACTVNLREDEACTLADLPLIGMTTQDPTIDDIMTRVVVTHDWMGTRFRELLNAWPPEIRLMMRGVTAVVISSEIRPSFYTTRTGAIYLDPLSMALTTSERSVVSSDPDPRSDDIQQFKFLILWRYVRDSGGGKQDLRAMPDSFEKVRLRTANLLFHELAHANDFFPPDQLEALDTTVPIYRAFSLPDIPSSRLSGTYPLTNEFMLSLARVAFHGQTPTVQQLALSADEVAMEFPVEDANDYYNYSTTREDLAMAFEEVMMLLTLSIDRDVGVVDFPPDPAHCDELTVSWGQRNRIADPDVGIRSRFVVDRILPEASAEIGALLAGLDGPAQMVAGDGWCHNIELGETTAGPTSSRSLTINQSRSVEDHVQALVPYL